MSGFVTHMTVGASAGLGLAAGLDVLRPGLLESLATAIPVIGTAQQHSLVPGGAAGVALVVGSAFLATLPDLDEPESWASQRLRGLTTIAGIFLGLFVAWAFLGQRATDPLASVTLESTIKASFWSTVVVVLGVIGGGALGYWLGHLILRGIRMGAGGHRRLTHSWVLAGGLAAVAAVLWVLHLGPLALIPAALAWGIFAHDIADLVTPAGLPVFYPLSEQDIWILPKGLRHLGEPIIFGVAVLSAAWILAGAGGLGIFFELVEMVR